MKHYTKEDLILSKDCYTITTVSRDRLYVAQVHPFDSESTANAKHIIKCWNQYNMLVDALTKISEAEYKRKKACGYDIEIDKIAKQALGLTKQN